MTESSNARQRGKLPTFSSLRQLKMLPVPDKTPVEYPSSEQTGLFCRVSPRTQDGTVRRTWVHRYKEKVVVDGEEKSVTRRKDLGLAVEVDKGDTVVSLDEAKAKVLGARTAAKQERSDGERSERLTVAKTWSYYSVEKPTHREGTREKVTGVYHRYLAYLGDRYLDELDARFWAKYVHDLKLGTLLVGKRKNEAGVEVPVHRGPVAPDTLFGILNTAALLYDIAHRYKGLEGIPKGENPPVDAKKLVGAKHDRQSRIPLAKVGRAWRASDQLMSPWWRDQLRMYLLTGLRRSLMVDLQFGEVDFAGRSLLISPHKKGTKRRGAKTPVDAPPIRVPLSATALQILRTRLEFAPDPKGAVWYAPKPTRGKDRKDTKLSDPRAAWTPLEEDIELHFTPSDLRRTFATLGAAASKDVFGVALLMLHSAKGLAEAAQIPGITVQYMDTEEAQERMRVAADEIAAKVRALAALPESEANRVEEPELPEVLEQALNASED